MSIPSPKCTTHEPLTPSPSCRPRADLIQNCPTLGILRPLYLLGFDSHSALPISARNTSIELTRTVQQQMMSQGKARLGLTEVNNHACPAARTVSPANAANLECFVQWPKVTFELDIFSELFILLILLQKFPDSFLDFTLPKRMSQSATLPPEATASHKGGGRGMGGGMDIRGGKQGSLLMKQKRKGKFFFVIYIRRKNCFFIYDVIVKQK